MKIKILTLILLCLWIPVSIDKFLNFEVFKTGILNQPFTDRLGIAVIYFLPILEILTVFLLLSQRLKLYGFLVSSLLMAVLTLYVTIALTGAWEKLPCGCGSVISGLTWKQHFFFNLFFLLISGYGLYITNIQRSGAVGGETAKGKPA